MLTDIKIFLLYVSVVTIAILVMYLNIVRQQKITPFLWAFLTLNIIEVSARVIQPKIIKITGSNYPLLHFFIPIYLLLVMILYVIWSDSQKFKRIVAAIVWLYLTIWFIFKITNFESWNDFNTFTIHAALMSIYMVGWHPLLRLAKQVDPFWKNPQWLICASIMLYNFTYSIVTFLVMYIWQKYGIVSYGLWNTHSAVSILTSCVYIYAMFLYWRQSVGTTSQNEARSEIE